MVFKFFKFRITNIFLLTRGVVFAQPDTVWKHARSAGIIKTEYELKEIRSKLTIPIKLALSVLAPKQIEKYMDSIQKEATDLVSRLIETTEKEGSADPFKFLELNSMNVIFSVCFGRKFDSATDPEFHKISTMIETSMKFAGLDNDLASFLPAISIIDYFAGKQATQRKFLKNEFHPTFVNIIKEARISEGPNVVKSLVENGFTLSEEDTVVFMSKIII